MSTAWPKRKLGELAEVSRGSSPRPIVDTRYFEGGTIPWVKIADATKSGKFLHDTKEHVNDFGASFSKRLPPGTILVAASGTLGYTQILGVEACAHDGWLILQNLRGLDRDFTYYVLKTLEQHFFNSAYGAAIQNINTDILRQTEIPFPSLSVQRRIAGILSAYDELMENSQRCIGLLEAMASAIYREWFVYFRFPGHEQLPRVASSLGDIPKGWKATTLCTQLSALESGKRPKGGIRDVEDGVPSIGAENINGIGRHDFGSEKFVPREFFQHMRKGVVRDRDVAIYKDGAYIGKSAYFRDEFPHTECCVNEHVFLLRADGVRLKQNALYLWLQEPDTVQAIRATNANAAQPGINQQSVGGLELVLPDEKTAAHFDRLVEPLLAEIINLAKRIQNLRRTRDLLLPRLLSGQLNVGQCS
jgi:type I restriction enzyme S subunit